MTCTSAETPTPGSSTVLPRSWPPATSGYADQLARLASTPPRSPASPRPAVPRWRPRRARADSVNPPGRDAGSGCSTAANTPPPPWQADPGCDGRAYSDISADADPNTGIQIYDSSPLPKNTAPAGWVVAGGTSVSAPLVAAYYALVESAGAGSADATIDSSEWAYDLPQAKLLNRHHCRLQRLVLRRTFVCTAGPATTARRVRAASRAPGARRARDRRPRPDGHLHPERHLEHSPAAGRRLPERRIDHATGGSTARPPSYGQATAHFPAGAGTAPVSGRGRADRPRAEHHVPLPPGGAESQGTGPMYGYDFTFTTAAASNTNGNGRLRRRYHLYRPPPELGGGPRRLPAAAPSRAAARPLTRTRSPGPSPPRSASRGSPRSAAHRPR